MIRNKHPEGIVDFIVRQKQGYRLHDNILIKADKGRDGEMHNRRNQRVINNLKPLSHYSNYQLTVVIRKKVESGLQR